jgi:hypothetical protein
VVHPITIQTFIAWRMRETAALADFATQLYIAYTAPIVLIKARAVTEQGKNG